MTKKHKYSGFITDTGYRWCNVCDKWEHPKTILIEKVQDLNTELYGDYGRGYKKAVEDVVNIIKQEDA